MADRKDPRKVAKQQRGRVKPKPKPVGNPGDGADASKNKPRRTKTVPIVKSPLGGVAPVVVPVSTTPPKPGRVERDLSKPPGTKDNPRLVKTYGFQAANLVKQERVRRSIERMAALNELTGTVRPGPEPAPGVRERIGEALSEILYGGTKTDRSMFPDRTPPVAQAGLAGAELATRPLNVWLESATQAAMNPKTVLGDVREFGTGVSQALGAAMAAIQNGDWGIVKELAEGVAADYARRYGSDWKKQAAEDPLFNLLDATAVGNAALRGVGIASDIPKLGTKGAVRASFNPSRAGRVREVSDDLGQTAEFRYGSSPVMRAIQDGYDIVSERLPNAVPGSAAKRIARRQTQIAKRRARRDQANLSPLVDFVKNPAARLDFTPGERSANTVARIRLFWESQLPAARRNNEGLTALRDWMVEQRRRLEVKASQPRPSNAQAVADSLDVPGAVAPPAAPTLATPADLRHITLLTERIAELDAAIAWTPNERYSNALSAMDEITEIVEEVILRGTDEAWLDTAPTSPPSPPRMERVTGEAAVAAQRTAFASRRNRLAAEVFGVEEPVGTFLPHGRRPVEELSSGTSGGLNPRTNTVITPSDRGRLNLGRYNNLDLARWGEIAPDPELLIRHANSAVGLSLMDEVRSILKNIGKPVPVGSPLPEKGYMVRDRKAPIPESYFNNLSSDDARLVEKSMDAYRADTIENVDVPPKQLEAAGWITGDDAGNWTIAREGVYWVPEDAVERLVHFMGGADARRIRGRASKAGQAVDVAENLTKIAILYTNPGYYAANLIGNMVFLGLQSDPVRATQSLVRAGILHRSDLPTWQKIGMDMGEGPAQALMQQTQGTGALGKVLDVQRGVARAAGIADRGPRVAAYIHAARSYGIKSRAQLKALMDSTDAEAFRLKDMIREDAARAMVDFDQLTPFEKTYLRRIIFVYPWLRGATAWSTQFVAEKPGKAAVLGAAGQAASELSNRNLGADQRETLPVSLWGSFVTGRDGNIANVVSAQSVNPVGTLEGIIGTLAGDTKYDVPYDFIHPLIQATARVAKEESPWGEHIGFLNALKDESLALAPGYSQAGYVLNPPSKMYADQSKLGTLLRRGTRVAEYPIEVGQATKSRENQKNPDGLKAYERDFAEWMVENKGRPVPPQVLKARQAKVEYFRLQDDLKEDLKIDSLSEDEKTAGKSDALSERRRAELKAQVLRGYGGNGSKIILELAAKFDGNEEMLSKVNNLADKLLGWDALERWDRVMGGDRDGE